MRDWCCDMLLVIAGVVLCYTILIILEVIP